MLLPSLLRRRRGRGNRDLDSHRRRGRDKRQDDDEVDVDERGQAEAEAEEDLDVTKEQLRWEDNKVASNEPVLSRVFLELELVRSSQSKSKQLEEDWVENQQREFVTEGFSERENSQALA